MANGIFDQKFYQKFFSGAHDYKRRKNLMFDYKYLERCGYGLGANSLPPYECGKPAIAQVWWDDSSNFMFVCEEHLNFIKNTEENEQ